MPGQKNYTMPTEREKMTNKKIFISLPAWEDTELLDTINKSISLFEESKRKSKEIKMPLIFPNNFIDELYLIERNIIFKFYKKM